MLSKLQMLFFFNLRTKTTQLYKSLADKISAHVLIGHICLEKAEMYVIVSVSAKSCIIDLYLGIYDFAESFCYRDAHQGLIKRWDGGRLAHA